MFNKTNNLELVLRMLRNGVRMGWRMSDFVRRMAENVTKEAQLAQRVQTNTLN